MNSYANTDPNVPIVVVETDPTVRSRLAMQLGERAVPADSVAGLSARYPSPFLLVLGPSCSAMPGTGGAEQLLVTRPDIGAILIAENL